MNKFIIKILFVTLVALGVTGKSFAQDANQISAEEKIKTLEEKLTVLEQKLSEFEAKKQPPAQTNAIEPKKFNELEQKVKILERQSELDKETAATKAKTAPIVTANTKEGFSIKSPDNDYILKLRGYVQADGRFVNGKKGTTTDDTFLLRRVRPIFEGTVFKDIDFRIMPDFGGGKTELQDAWLDFKYFPAAKLQIGKFKTPFGIERLQSGTDTLFIERGLPNNLVPNRDLGAALHGENLLGNKLSYAFGIFNGVADGGSLDSDIDNNKELAGRIFLTPWKGGNNSLLEGLGFGVATTAGDAKGTSSTSYLPSYKTPGQATFFSYRSGTFADGRHTRYSPQAYYNYGSFGLLGEYVVSSQDVKRNTSKTSLDNKAWQIAASYVLTGEAASYKGVTPKNNFNPGKGKWGALEVVGRIGQLDVDSKAFPTFADPAASAKSAKAWGFGFNWYWNKNVKWMLDYELTKFSGGDSGGDRQDERAVMVRSQISF